MLACNIAASLDSYCSTMDLCNTVFNFELPQTSDLAMAWIQAQTAGASGSNLEMEPAFQLNTENCYLGLRWGTERIWKDDLVWLRYKQDLLDPDGSEDVFAASNKAARYRRLYLKLMSIFRIDHGQIDGGRANEYRASGLLYELADDDWEDSLMEPNSSRQGKERVNNVYAFRFDGVS